MLYILDPNLTDYVGHHYEYARSLAEAAQRRGLDCIILANNRYCSVGFDLKVVPVFEFGIWQGLPGSDFHSQEHLVWSNDRFAEDAIRYLDQVTLAVDDIIFIPTLTKAQINGAARIIEKFGPSKASFEIMMRYPAPFFDGDYARDAFRKLERLAKTFSARLSADSSRLAREYAQLTLLPISVFPIPHTDHSSNGGSSLNPNSSLHLVSLGNARGEKGIAEILAAILSCRHELWAQDIRFTIQVNDPSDDAIKCIQEFKSVGDSRTTLIEQPSQSMSLSARLSSLLKTKWHSADGRMRRVHISVRFIRPKI